MAPDNPDAAPPPPGRVVRPMAAADRLFDQPAAPQRRPGGSVPSDGRSAVPSRSGGRGAVSSTARDRRERAAARSGGGSGADQAPGHPEDFPGDPESVARAVCLRLLAGQPRTRAELAAALAGRGVPVDAAAAVLGRFAEVGLIDDLAFAEAWVGSRHTGRGLARRALASELRRRGVDAGIVGEAIATLDPATEERTARELVARRLAATRRFDPPVRVRRLVGMLARKGYPPGLAVQVVREELAAEGADPGELADLDDSGPDNS